MRINPIDETQRSPDFGKVHAYKNYIDLSPYAMLHMYQLTKKGENAMHYINIDLHLDLQTKIQIGKYVHFCV